MMRFYGMTWDQIENMPMPKFDEYFMALDVLEARESLDMIEIISVPHMSDKSSREKVFKKYSKRIESHKPTRVISPKELARMLSNGR